MKTIVLILEVIIVLFSYCMAQSIVRKDSLDGLISTITVDKSELILTVLNRNNKSEFASTSFGHNYYGSLLWSTQDLRVLNDLENNKLICFQTSFGGDGEHTSNYLIMYRFKQNKLISLYFDQLSDINFEMIEKQVRSVSGTKIVSLCNVCDGDDAASPEDLFKIPLRIIIDGNSSKVFCTLSLVQKDSLLIAFEKIKKNNLTEQRKYSESQFNTYNKYAKEVELKLIKLLDLRK